MTSALEIFAIAVAASLLEVFQHGAGAWLARSPRVCRLGQASSLLVLTLLPFFAWIVASAAIYALAESLAHLVGLRDSVPKSFAYWTFFVSFFAARGIWTGDGRQYAEEAERVAFRLHNRLAWTALATLAVVGGLGLATDVPRVFASISLVEPAVLVGLLAAIAAAVWSLMATQGMKGQAVSDIRMRTPLLALVVGAWLFVAVSCFAVSLSAREPYSYTVGPDQWVLGGKGQCANVVLVDDPQLRRTLSLCASSEGAVAERGARIYALRGPLGVRVLAVEPLPVGALPTDNIQPQN